MSDPRNCYHGVRMMGPNPPPCLECEIIWHTDSLKWLTKATERHQRKLDKALAERAAFEAAKGFSPATAPQPDNGQLSEQNQSPPLPKEPGR
jgi:hypothetical protein